MKKNISLNTIIITIICMVTFYGCSKKEELYVQKSTSFEKIQPILIQKNFNTIDEHVKYIFDQTGIDIYQLIQEPYFVEIIKTSEVYAEKYEELYLTGRFVEENIFEFMGLFEETNKMYSDFLFQMEQYYPTFSKLEWNSQIEILNLSEEVYRVKTQQLKKEKPSKCLLELVATLCKGISDYMKGQITAVEFMGIAIKAFDKYLECSDPKLKIE